MCIPFGERANALRHVLNSTIPVFCIPVFIGDSDVYLCDLFYQSAVSVAVEEKDLELVSSHLSCLMKVGDCVTPNLLPRL